MSLSTAQTALLTAVSTSLGPIPTEWENVPFTKPASAKWAQVFFLPNPSAVETLGSVGEDMVTGIVQININYPQAIGDSASRADAETIRSSFKAGTALISSSQVVKIQNCYRSAGRLVDQWWRISITIAWYALIPR